MYAHQRPISRTPASRTPHGPGKDRIDQHIFETASPHPRRQRFPRSRTSAQPQALAAYEAKPSASCRKANTTRPTPPSTRCCSPAPAELADRIRMYINACLGFRSPRVKVQASRATKSSTTTPSRCSTTASTKMPLALQADPRRENPGADYAFYGLAVLASMTGDSNRVPRPSHRTPSATTPAIASRPAPTPTSRTWPTTPRFTELLYPEA